MSASTMETSIWSLETFCSLQNNLLQDAITAQNNLPVSSAEFLRQLGLPSAHPFCTHPNQTLIHPMAPPMGPPSDFEYPSLWDEVLTEFWYRVPPTAALAYLFANLFAIYLVPVGFFLLLLLLLYSHRYGGGGGEGKAKSFQAMCTEALFHATYFFSWLIMTDDQYVLAFGRSLGVMLVLMSLRIGLELTRHRLVCRPGSFHYRLLALTVVCWLLSPWGLYDREEILNLVEPGLYYNHDNPRFGSMVQRWSETLPDYDREAATKWQWTGDARTGLPYLLNQIDDENAPIFHRVWLNTTDDNEYVALDIVFPATGHNANNPLYLVLHGLNGGSKEGYVMDLAASRTKAGSTVVVMIARGLMETPIQGWTFFHGIRIADVHAAASTLRQRVLQPHQTLAGVGYSMGAIVLNRYVSTQPDVALDVSVSISGALCTLYQKDFERSKRTWQRVITGYMKDMFFRGKWGNRLHRMLGSSDYQGLLRAQNIVETDYYAGVLFNGYDSLAEFYTVMSSILPYPQNNSTHADVRQSIPIPHLVLQAMDDPLSTWRTNAASDPKSALYPTKLVSSESQPNLVLLLTATGGHVGWPMSWWPHSWEFMNDMVAAGFVDALAIS